MNGVEPAGYFLAVGMNPFPNMLMESVEGFNAMSASTSREMSSCADRDAVSEKQIRSRRRAYGTEFRSRADPGTRCVPRSQ